MIKIPVKKYDAHTCDAHYIKQLRILGIKTTGTHKALKNRIIKHGFGLPEEHIEMQKEWVWVHEFNREPKEILMDVPRHYYGFSLQHNNTCYVRLCLTRENAMAAELILLKKLKLI